jgi:hypothetical protein
MWPSSGSFSDVAASARAFADDQTLESADPILGLKSRFRSAQDANGFERMLTRGSQVNF